ncbi:MAG: VOC family protein [Gammaproteobacteria bacterium]|nr:VOC family protein [Gammaproteobacteria bacterium]
MKAANFVAAYPYQNDVLALPVSNVNEAASWYGQNFGMQEIERGEQPNPFVILERDGVKIGFAENGGDPTQDGAAVLVSGITEIRTELESREVNVSDWRIDEREGKQLKVFFVTAPDGLCYYFHEEVASTP